MLSIIVYAVMNYSPPMTHVLWNSFLALIPVVLAYAMLWIYKSIRRRAVRNSILLVLAAVWLAFLPNTCYLITQWRHYLMAVDLQNLYLQAKSNKSAFMQLCGMSIFYLSYSGYGVAAFALAIRPMERIARSAGATIWFWGLPFFTAMSVGVYLGLVLRFNSWDLLQRPGEVWTHVAALGGRPLLGAFIVAFGIFLWLLYEAVDVWIDALTERWSQITGRRVHVGPKEGKASV